MKDLIIKSETWPGIDKSIFVEKTEENRKSISCVVSQEQMSGMSKFNIDSETLIYNTLFSEISRSIQTEIVNTSFQHNLSGTETIEFDEIKELFKFLKDKSRGFIITNVQIATRLQDEKEMGHFETVESIPGSIYQVGFFSDIKVYVDPMINWDDNKCLLVENDFYNFYISEDMPSKFICEGTSAPKYIKDFYLKIKNPINTIITINQTNFI